MWVVGSLNIDHTMYLDRLPLPGETVLGFRLEVRAGGKGANQAVACARLGVPTSLVACVGEDALERGVIDDIKSYGIDIKGVHYSKTPTGTALVLVDKLGNNSIAVFAGANHDISAGRGEFAPRDAVLVQCEIPFSVLSEVVTRAHACGCLVAVNAAPAMELPAQVLRQVDLLIVNEVEVSASLRLADDVMPAVAAGDGDALAVLVSAASATGVESVVVTMGSLGSVVVAAGDVTIQKAFPVDAVDAVGAGDAFAAALVARRLEGFTMPDAVNWASAAAALTVRKIGTFEAFPIRREVGEFLGKQ